MGMMDSLIEKERADMSNTYHYVESGLHNVYLLNGYEEYYDKSLSSNVTRILRVAKLHEIISKTIAINSAYMSSQEFKFLRTELGYSQEQLGRLFGIEAIVVHQRETELNPDGAAANLLRLMILEHLNIPLIPEGVTTITTSPIVTFLVAILNKRAGINRSPYHFKYEEGQWIYVETPGEKPDED